MRPEEYQLLAARTLVLGENYDYTPQEKDALMAMIGLAGETGEVVDYLKKGIIHHHGVDPETLKIELGDSLWYIGALCTIYGLSLEDVMVSNIEKLKLRYPTGFSSEASKLRVDTLNKEE